jgi:hypothetical protein
MDTTTQHDEVCGLIVAACELLERGRRADVADAGLDLEVAVLLTELHAQGAGVDDPQLTDDLAAVASELEVLQAHLDRLPHAVTALTG